MDMFKHVEAKELMLNINYDLTILDYMDNAGFFNKLPRTVCVSMKFFCMFGLMAAEPFNKWLYAERSPVPIRITRLAMYVKNCR